jgi:hypothetical protein
MGLPTLSKHWCCCIFQHGIIMKSIIFWDMTPCSPYFCTRLSSETSGKNIRTTRRHIPEDGTLQNHPCENLKSYRIIMLYFNGSMCAKHCRYITHSYLHVSITKKYTAFRQSINIWSVCHGISVTLKCWTQVIHSYKHDIIFRFEGRK